MPTSCLASFSACTARRTSKEQAWDWPLFNESFISTAGASGLKRRSIRALRFSSALRLRTTDGKWRMVTREGRMATTREHEEIGILLVEDDPLDLEMTMRALQSDHVNNRIEVARDGEEALDFLFCRGAYSSRSPQQQPKLVLLDLKLPKIDGLEVLREIRATPQTRAIPVVILTSSAEQRDIVETYKLGVNSYIQKPVDSTQFRQTVKTAGYYWLVVNRPSPARA